MSFGLVTGATSVSNIGFRVIFLSQEHKHLSSLDFVSFMLVMEQEQFSMTEFVFFTFVTGITISCPTVDPRQQIYRRLAYHSNVSALQAQIWRRRPKKESHGRLKSKMRGHNEFDVAFRPRRGQFGAAGALTVRM